MHITPIKNLVKIKDYHSYLLRQSIIWTNLKSMFLKQNIEQIEQQTEEFKQHTVKVKSWKNPFLAFSDLPDDKPTEEQLETTNKLAVVQQRLELLENEWNRTEYYMLYQFEMIEIPPELSDSFFSYTIEEMKSNLTYH